MKRWREDSNIIQCSLEELKIIAKAFQKEIRIHMSTVTGDEREWVKIHDLSVCGEGNKHYVFQFMDNSMAYTEEQAKEFNRRKKMIRKV